MAFCACNSLSTGGNPRSGSSDPTATADRCHPLLEGAVLAAHGVSGVGIDDVGRCAWSWAASQGVGINGAMYDITGASSIASSSGPARSCNTVADSSMRLRWGVR